jgi:hypothetical protein
MKNGKLEDVEDKKTYILEYRNTCMSLGSLGDSAETNNINESLFNTSSMIIQILGAQCKRILNN